MPDLIIDREILIEAPVEVVWRTITEPDQITQWFADRVEAVIEPGAHGYMEFGDQGGPVVVETVDLAGSLLLPLEPPPRERSRSSATRCWWNIHAYARGR